MIEWTNELIVQIDSYSRAALSYPGESGYPVTLPLPFTFDPGGALLRSPKARTPTVYLNRWRGPDVADPAALRSAGGE
jgi:hypothetical protein